MLQPTPKMARLLKPPLPPASITRTKPDVHRSANGLEGGVGVLAAFLGWVTKVAVTSCLSAGLTSQQWGQKKAAAKSLADLAEAGGDALPPHTPTLISTILQVVLLRPGLCSTLLYCKCIRL